MDLRLQQECKENIVKYLRNLNGPAELSDLKIIYTLTYRRNHHVVIADRLSRILAKLEHEGHVVCEYTPSGLVNSVRLKCP